MCLIRSLSVLCSCVASFHFAQKVKNRWGRTIEQRRSFWLRESLSPPYSVFRLEESIGRHWQTFRFVIPDLVQSVVLVLHFPSVKHHVEEIREFGERDRRFSVFGLGFGLRFHARLLHNRLRLGHSSYYRTFAPLLSRIFDGKFSEKSEFFLFSSLF